MVYVPNSCFSGVVIHELRILVAGRPDLVLQLDTPEKIRAVEAHRLVVKEGVSFSTKLIFSVHKDVVLGLRFAQKVRVLLRVCPNISTKLILRLGTFRSQD